MKEIKDMIVKHYAGSHAYGTNTETSDVDFRGIFGADKRMILSPFLNVKEVTDVSEEDTKYYELLNYMKLYTQGNPNVLETLWVDDRHIVQSSEAYEYLRGFRQQLLSSKVAYTFTGFAHAQSTRLKNHSSWIAKELAGMDELKKLISTEGYEQCASFIEQNFPEYITKHLDLSPCRGKYIKGFFNSDKVMRSTALQMLSSNSTPQKLYLKMQHNFTPEQVFQRDFDIRHYNHDHMLYPYGNELYGLMKMPGEFCVNDDGSIHKIDINQYPAHLTKEPPLFIIKFCKKEYEQAVENRNNYHTWKKNRNEARAELEFEYGYDTKYAMHTVRILRMAEELLSTGILNVYRDDAKELLDIKNGKWTYKEVMEYNENSMRNIMENLYPNTDLPKTPDFNLGSDIVVKLREMLWYGK